MRIIALMLTLVLGACAPATEDVVQNDVVTQEVVRTGDPYARGYTDEDFPRIQELAEGVYSYEQLRPAGEEKFTFSAPGDYMLRVRANDASGVSGAGHAQCCWTNGFVKVTVTQ